MKFAPIPSPVSAPSFMGGVAAIAGSRYGNRIRFEAPAEGGAEPVQATEVAPAEVKADPKPAESVTKPNGLGTQPAEVPKPALSDKEAELLKEVMAKKKTNESLQGLIDQMNAKLKEFEGLNPEEARAAVAAKKDAELKAAEAAGDFDRVKAMMAEQHKAATDSLNARIADLESQLGTRSKAIDDLTVGTAFAQSSFIAEELVLTPAKARVIYGGHFEIEGGRAVGYDKPKGEEGRTRLVDASGNPVGFEDALKRLVEADPDRDRLVKSKLAPGAKSSTADAKPTVAQATSTVSGRSRIELALLARQKK